MHGNPGLIRCARIAAARTVQGVALLGGLALAAMLMRQGFAHEATPVQSRLGSVCNVDGGCEPTNECRAHYGNIFFGRVIGVEARGRFVGGPRILYIVYIVDVESLLRHSPSQEPMGREPEGRVQIQVSGLDMSIEKNGRTAPLMVGARYLFFAGGLLNRGYVVDGEVGFLPVADDAEAAKLTEEFTPLIRQAEQDARETVARMTAAAGYEPLTPPVAEIVPARGPAGSEVVESGSGFTPTDVVFLWDEGNPQTLPEVAADADGRFEITLTVPGDRVRAAHAHSRGTWLRCRLIEVRGRAGTEVARAKVRRVAGGQEGAGRRYQDRAGGRE